MIEDPVPLQENSMDNLLKLLKFVDCTFTEDMLSESPPQLIGAVVPSTSFQGSVHCGSPGQISCKAKCHKLSANQFIDVTTVKNNEEDERDEEENGTEELIHHPPSGKTINAIDAID